ncbi:histidine phosphotransferase family protein [Profundibacter sp.]|uniref:histidine phosphotransferase family protein n=1 Tax=Profundibacter sp. TaxID=3101071 RepID=UPI003D12499B
MNTQSTIAALIGSRICHDLISPLGAIGNGVELLGMAGSVDGPEMALISESVASANARIRFFRIAFGAAGSGAMVGLSEITSILRDMGAAGRVQYDWNSENSLPRSEVKLAFLLIQCFESAMAFGGTVKVRQGPDGWRLACTADKMNIDPQKWEMLVSPINKVDLSPSDVHFALVPDAVQQAGRALKTDLREGTIALSF